MQKQHTGQKMYTWPQNQGSNRNQHRNNKVNDFYRTNNADSIGIQRKIKNMFEYRSDPFGNILSLSKYSFSLNTYKLLNQNLNFVPTPKQYSQKQIDTDTENFSHLLKLHAHIKDVNETQTSDQLYQPFKVKNKTKWTPKEKHHTPKSFIDLVQHDINKMKIKKSKKP